MRSLRLRLATIVAVSCLAITLACLWSRESYVIGCAWWALRWPVGLMGLALLISGLRQRRMFLTAICAATVGLVATESASVAIAHSRPPRDLETPLTVVTHNLLFEGNSLTESLAGMRDAGADVIAMQEVTPRDAERLANELSATHPFHAEAPHVGAHGFAFFSKHPISDVQLVRFEGKLPFAQCLTLSLPDGPLPVCNVHLSAPAKELRNFATLPDLDGLERNAVRRRKEWSMVEAELDRRGGNRALALGDFNSLEAEPLYRSIRDHWVDAFRQLHFDWGATWPNRVEGRVPFARIDYVFSRGALRPLESKVISRSGSDHLAVSARLAR